jgi:hypothetical protein
MYNTLWLFNLNHQKKIPLRCQTVEAGRLIKREYRCKSEAVPATVSFIRLPEGQYV